MTAPKPERNKYGIRLQAQEQFEDDLKNWFKIEQSLIKGKLAILKAIE